MSDLPAALRTEVVVELYRQIDDVDWEGMPVRERSLYYDQWLDDPNVGGKLTRFLSRERARVWLKDGPIKELPRARNGLGRYADYVGSRYPGPAQIARQSLGNDWVVELETILVKPNRCRVRGPEGAGLMIWGPSEALKNMLWAAMNAVLDEALSPHIVVTTPQGTRLTETRRERNQQLARLAGVQLTHTTLRLTKCESRAHG